MEFKPIGEEANFTDYSLVVPAVSVGNVGQLSCDLIINTLKLKKVGYLWSTCVLPVIGSDPFQSEKADSLTLSLEIFIDAEQKIAVLQQRAPVVAGKQREFSNNLIKWIESCGFSSTTILTSCHAYERMDAEIRGSSVKFLTHSDDSSRQTLLDKNFQELRKKRTEFGEECYIMPGGGIAKNFYDECVVSNPSFKLVILIVYCSEGDNIPEAVLLADVANSLKNLVKITELKLESIWKIPSSWKHLFGSKEPDSIF